jgi:hypothetical protein
VRSPCKDRCAAYRLGKRLRANAAKARAPVSDGRVAVEDVVIAVSALLDGMGLTAFEAAPLLAVIGVEIEGDAFTDTVKRVLGLRDRSRRTCNPTTPT